MTEFRTQNGAPPKITSAANPLIKLLKSLHAKKGRSETGLFLAEGARLASEAAELGVFPELLIVSESALERPQVRSVVESAKRAGARWAPVSESVLEQVSKRDNPQTVIGAYRQKLAPLNTLQGDLFVALEAIRDPGNLGTILRTADSVGAGGVILIGPGCDPFSVEAVRASMGSIFAMPIARASFDDLLTFKNARGSSLFGASLKGQEFALNLPAPQSTIVLMGNEQSGLPPEMEDGCDRLVKLPMKGRADSLNLAIATAVMLYDVWRRRGYDGAR